VAESYASLSSEEVALLLRMNTQTSQCAVTEPDVVPFDFYGPEALTKEQEQSLRSLQSAFARQTAGSLSTLLHSAVHMDLELIDAIRYETFVASLWPAAVTAVCRSLPLEGYAIFALEPCMALALVDRLMGGPGDKAATVRTLTEIEVALISRLFSRMLACWRSAWQHVLDIQPTLDQVESGSQLTSLMPTAEHVLVFTFSMVMRHAESEIRLCIPLRTIKPVLPGLSEQAWLQENFTATPAQEVAQQLLATQVTLSVELGSANITVLELLDLQVGDCVVLDTLEGAALPVKVADQVRLWGQLGVVNRNYAVSITCWDGEDDAVQNDQPGIGGAEA
jgi:flagellar motor switch protein FliM